MSPPPIVSRPKPPSAAKTFWKMLFAESMAKSAVVNATPFRAACVNSRASIGRTPTMPWVSTQATRTTSSLSSSILAMICASLSRRSGQSCLVRATKSGRPSEFSAALVMFVLLLSDGISEASANGMQWSSRRLRSAPFR
jgi:hypothetical protein